MHPKSDGDVSYSALMFRKFHGLYCVDVLSKLNRVRLEFSVRESLQGRGLL